MMSPATTWSFYDYNVRRRSLKRGRAEGGREGGREGNEGERSKIFVARQVVLLGSTRARPRKAVVFSAHLPSASTSRQVHPQRRLADPSNPAPNRLLAQLPRGSEPVAAREPKVPSGARRALQDINGLAKPVLRNGGSEGLDLELVVGARAGQRPPDGCQRKVDDSRAGRRGSQERPAGLV